MNKDKKLFNLHLFNGGTSITRGDAEALIPVQESREIIQGVVEQSAVLQRGKRLANMTSAQTSMPVGPAPHCVFCEWGGRLCKEEGNHHEVGQERDLCRGDCSDCSHCRGCA